MPGLPRRRPETRPHASAHGTMPRTVPILPKLPEPAALPDPRPSLRLSWSKTIVDGAQRGESVAYEPVHGVYAARPVRSQAAARARAGEAFHPVTPTPEPRQETAILVNSAPLAPIAVSEEMPPDQMDFPAPPVETAWTRIRNRFGSLLGVFHRG